VFFEKINPFVWPMILFAGVYCCKWITGTVAWRKVSRLYLSDFTCFPLTPFCDRGIPARFSLCTSTLKYMVCSFFSLTGSKKFLLVGMVMSVFGVLMFETYYQIFECQVSDRYYRENFSNGKSTVEFFQNENIDIWADYATLLSVVREEGVTIWDQDMDFSVMYPGDVTVQQLRDKLALMGKDTVLDKSRGLLQIHPRGQPGPHADVWFWYAESVVFPEGPEQANMGNVTKQTLVRNSGFIRTLEYVDYNPRLISDIFPLQLVEWPQGGMRIQIPAKSDLVCAKEYSNWVGTWRQARAFRNDCFHNMFQRRFMY